MSEQLKGGSAISRAIPSPLKWHIDGGKAYLASRIIALMPPRKTAANPDGWLHYVEPFAGSLAVLLAQDPEGISEVVNDLNGSLINFWHVIRDEERFPRFLRMVEATPFSQDHWDASRAFVELQEENVHLCGDWITDESLIRWAALYFICCRQSMAGRMTAFAPLSRTRTRRGMNEQASAWLNAVEGLPAVHARLKRVVILNRDALDVIRQQDGPQTLFYLDPPYLHETRATTGEYAHEMSDEGHRNLLCLLRQCKGKVMLSGYRSAMYDDLLAGWERHEFDLPNNSASGDTKQRRIECVWCNYEVPS